MRFSYSKENLSAPQARLQRLFEILPGLTSWAILTAMVLLSIFSPFTAAIITIAFYLCWLLRLLYMTLFLVLSYIRLNLEGTTDWMGRVHGIDHSADYLKILNARHGLLTFKQRFSVWLHRRELRKLTRSSRLPPSSKDIYHLVIFPILKENAQIIGAAVEAVSRQLFRPKQIIVVFALEKRAAQEIKNDVHAIAQKYHSHFLDCFTVLHPDEVPGEARVKGANVTCAARKAKEYIEANNIPLENVICSCFDADTVVSKHYFSCLTYHFMVTPDRQRASFQPIPVYHNNIWQVPGFARVIETGSSFFQLIEATNPEKLVTFSSHSMSFKALVEVGYWPVDMISDDSAIFWKCYVHYDGHYRVIPMYVTLSMDVACADNWWNTVKNVYKQKRRWAWGVENFPLVMRAFLGSDKIPLYDKLRHGFKLFEGHISWATWGFLLSIIGWMPVLFARREFASSVVYYNVPEIANTIFNLASLCLVTSIVLSLSLLPKTTIRYSGFKKLGHALEWLMIPVILVIFGALPALDAQTRLMRARYLEFWVTDKHRKK
ncbi:MAG: glycosyltransferase family 2 protein [Candidatus Omnitrophica bacterium]|nr:glycosyltransferase family 2 protein [Candidatus Omnitrophota bacterium]